MCTSLPPPRISSARKCSLQIPALEEGLQDAGLPHTDIHLSLLLGSEGNKHNLFLVEHPDTEQVGILSVTLYLCTSHTTQEPRVKPHGRSDGG